MNDFSTNKACQLPQTSIIKELGDINDMFGNPFSWFNLRFDDYQYNNRKSALKNNVETPSSSPFLWSHAPNSMDQSRDIMMYDTPTTVMSFYNSSLNEAPLSCLTTLRDVMYDSVSLDSYYKNRSPYVSGHSVDNNVLPRIKIGCIASTTVPKLEKKQDVMTGSYSSVTKSCGFLLSCTRNMPQEEKTCRCQQTASTFHNFSLNSTPQKNHESKIPHIQSSHLHYEENKIIDIWVDNLEQEFSKIRDIVNDFPFVALDTEFPGIVARPKEHCSDYNYKTVKCNVDLLNVIQLGITFANEEGFCPKGTSSWQFNFKFDLNQDMYAQDSIDFLRKNGINFYTHQSKGIDVHRFGELMIASGLVLNKKVKWITFHGSYDFAYLLKLLTCAPLPNSDKQFFKLLNEFFPSLYDIKYFLKKCSSIPLRKGLSLQGVAEYLKVKRIGPQHQAGSDSLLTFFSGFLYGLNDANVEAQDHHSFHETKKSASFHNNAGCVKTSILQNAFFTKNNEPLMHTPCKELNEQKRYENFICLKEKFNDTVIPSSDITSQQNWRYSKLGSCYDENQKDISLIASSSSSSSVNLVSQITSDKKKILFSSQFLKSHFIDSFTGKKIYCSNIDEKITA
ncbi:uncharacterized protein LOC128883738 isoform X2 [Hylaeus volcanicus]|uniref:uncharacterized protein LOC128883738 isoform X2 n=1 Tax=Hylaeus volcanicus TaxID=313075 RepID=UPI0023B790BB|nr:uncharacterized protein LOC128883738 isoform X2 [Hylaeus volcanicus]